jgi:hypothetical protein
MNLNEMVPLLINIIAPFISAFLGAFFGYRFSLKQRFSEDKKEVYYKLLEYLPASIPISQGDISQEYLSAGSPESSINILKIKIEDYEKQLEKNNFTSEQREALEVKRSNSRYTIEQLERYIEFFSKTLKNIAEFERSQLFNLFKIYASNDVRKAYVRLNVAISNDYHACFNVPSRELNILLDQLLFAIKADLNK